MVVRFEQKVIAEVSGTINLTPGQEVLVSGAEPSIGDSATAVRVRNGIDLAGKEVPIVVDGAPADPSECGVPVRNNLDVLGSKTPLVVTLGVGIPHIEQFCVFGYITGLEAARISVPSKAGYLARSITVPAGKILVVLDVRFSYCVKLTGSSTIYSTNAPTGPLGNQVALAYPPSIYAKLASGFVGPIPVAPTYFDEVASAPVFVFGKTVVRKVGEYQQDGQSGQRKRNKGIFVAGETVHLVSHWAPIANIDAAAGGGIYLEMESMLIEEKDAAVLLPSLLA